MISTAAAICLALVILPQNSWAQVAPRVTRDDSVRLAAELFQRTLRDTNVDSTQLIWLRADTAAGSTSRLRLTPQQAAAVMRLHPRIRLVSPAENLFLCPPGRVVRMPGSGCPIREDGVIVSLFDFRVAGDSLIAGGDVIKSRGDSTWAEGMAYVFRWAKGAWTFVRLLDRSIT